MTWNILWHQAMTQTFFKGLVVKKDRTFSFPIFVTQNASALRLHLANYTSRKEARVEAEIEYAGEIYPIRKDGTTKIRIPAKGEINTDELPITLKAGSELQLHLYHSTRFLDCNGIEEDTLMYKGNALNRHTSTLIPPKDIEVKLGVFRHIPYINRVEICCEQPSKNIIAFGDSITAMSRWTKPLAKRLYEAYGSEYTLLNSGICGNCLTYEAPGVFHDVYGKMGTRRYERDVLALGNVTAVIMSFGINDVSYMTPKTQEAVNLDKLISETIRMCEIFHQKGIRVIVQTLGPRKHYAIFTPEMEQMRQKYNAWVRTAEIFDYVVDAEPKLLQDGTNDTYKDGLHQGDYLHPNKQGGEIIANTFDLNKLVGKS